MSTHQNKTSLKKLISLAGVASASVFLSVPAIAQTSTYNGCGSYRGNATTGGGWYCAMDRVNQTSSNREASTMERESTTGANSSETGVNSNSGRNTTDSQSTDSGSRTIEGQSTESTDSGSRTIERQSTTSQSTTVEQRSNTTTYPATPVTPRSETAPSEQPQQPTNNTPAVNESTDQGVRALW